MPRGQVGKFTSEASPKRGRAADSFDRDVGLVLDRVMQSFVRRLEKVERGTQELAGERGGDASVRQSQAPAIVDAPQEVFIGAPATLPGYPALVFTERTIDGQTVYEMQVNVP